MESTKVFVDSINAVVKLLSEIPAPKQECYANWDYVAITAIISFAIVVTIIWCIIEYRALMHGNTHSSFEQENKKREWELEDKERKHNIEILDREYKRKIEIINSQYSKKQDLLTQKLSLLNELCYTLEPIKEINEGKEFVKFVKKIKDLDSDEVKLYLSELNKALENPDTESKSDVSDNVKTDNND